MIPEPVDQGQVVAICPSTQAREPLLVRAWLDFESQSYRDRRMLVLTADRGYAERLRAQGRYPYGVEIRYVPEGEDPGILLRVGLAAAQDGPAAFVTLWDDDCAFHRDRLARQVAACDAAGCPNYLSACAWHFVDSGEVFLVEMEERHKPLASRVLPWTACWAAGTIDPGLLRGPALGRGSPTAALGRVIIGTGQNVTRCDGEYGLMRVLVWGGNAQGYDWHRQWATSSKTKSAAWLRERRPTVEKWLAADECPGWDLPAVLPNGIVSVCGRDGEAFEMHVCDRRWRQNREAHELPVYQRLKTPLIPPLPPSAIEHVHEEI